MANVKCLFWNWNYWTYELNCLKAFKRSFYLYCLFYMKRMHWQVVRIYIQKLIHGRLGERRKRIYSNENWRWTLELQFNAYKVRLQYYYTERCIYKFMWVLHFQRLPTNKKCIIWSLQHFTIENIKCMRCRIVFNFHKIFPFHPRQW